MSGTKEIGFPEDEISGLAGRGSIATHRVSDDARRFKAGDVVRAPWGSRYVVSEKDVVPRVEDSPYYDRLTDAQRGLLRRYRRIAILRLSGRLSKSASCGMRKSAASKLRAMLNAGRLTAEQISRFRSLGMLPSRERYVDGARKMLKSRLEKIFAVADRRGTKLTVNPGVPRGESEHVVTSPANTGTTTVKIPLSSGRMAHVPVSMIVSPEMSEHLLNLP